MTFGMYLKTLRLSKNIEAKELGHKIGTSGPYITMLENCKTMAPNQKMVIKICRALGVEHNELWELAALERINSWLEKEGIEPAKAILFYKGAVSKSKEVVKKLSKLNKATVLRKVGSLVICTLPSMEILNVLRYIMSTNLELP